MGRERRGAVVIDGIHLERGRLCPVAGSDRARAMSSEPSVESLRASGLDGLRRCYEAADKLCSLDSEVGLATLARFEQSAASFCPFPWLPLARARMDLERRQYRQARRGFRELLEEVHPEEPYAQLAAWTHAKLGLAATYESVGALESAVDVLHSADESLRKTATAEPVHARVVFRIGVIREKQGLLKSAESAYQELAERFEETADPTSILLVRRAWDRRAKLLEQLGRRSEALEVATRLGEVSPWVDESVYEALEAAVQVGEPARKVPRSRKPERAESRGMARYHEDLKLDKEIASERARQAWRTTAEFIASLLVTGGCLWALRRFEPDSWLQFGAAIPLSMIVMTCWMYFLKRRTNALAGMLTVHGLWGCAGLAVMAIGVFGAVAGAIVSFVDGFALLGVEISPQRVLLAIFIIFLCLLALALVLSRKASR
jgi:tetratricopeptide (TPR) repeat protein